jgi:predicted extracellular nuclease
MEWMKRLFYTDGTPKTKNDTGSANKKEGLRSEQLATVVKAIDPDILCIVEGPDTLASGEKTASQQLMNWCALHDLNEYDAVHGITSGGQQELCAIYKRDKVKLIHDPVTDKTKNPFDEAFYVDTIDSLIKEEYTHYRPPFEISVRDVNENALELAKIIVAHTKSKGIFDSVDMARYEQLSERNRRKLYAECYSIRERVDQWMDGYPDRKIIVCGDINDGSGMDFYEHRYSKSAMEILLGNIWHPEKILRHVLSKPKIGKYGWSPSSSKYKDAITKNTFTVLIDHILVSQNLEFDNSLVWNPNDSKAPQFVKDIKKELKAASDHFPVTVELTI